MAESSGDCELGSLEWLVGGMMGALVGAVSAVTIDATVLAREEVPADPHRKDAAKRDSIRLTPTIRPAPGSVAAGVVGTF